MSGAPGWYPDPGGQPDCYRYWDGERWSAQTTADPGGAAPQSMTAAAPVARPRAVRWLITITVLAVAVAIAAVALQIRERHDQPVLFPDPTAGATRSPRADATPSGSPSPEPTARNIGCPEGAPDARAPHPADDRVYGGNLSFPRVAAFTPERSENRLTFAYDLTQQVRTVSLDPPWIAQLGAGRLIADGYPRDAEHTAEFVTECIVASELYEPYDPQRRDVVSRAIRVSGTDAWLLTTDVVVSVPQLGFAGDHLAVVVVPDGADWGLFFGAVPIGDRELTATLTRTILSLRVG
jgi:hypothetical protein